MTSTVSRGTRAERVESYTGCRDRMPTKAAAVARQIRLAHEVGAMTPQQRPNEAERLAGERLELTLKVEAGRA